MIKRLIIILSFFPFSIFAQTGIILKIQTLDDEGLKLPNCDIAIATPNDTTQRELKTDKNGMVCIFVDLQSEVLVHGYCDNYFYQKKKVLKSEIDSKNDTVFITLNFKPISSIMSRFQSIDLDSTYSFGNLSDLRDTIILYSNFNRILPKQNYTVLKKVKSNNYHLLYWEMSNSGIVDPTEFRYELKVKMKKNDKVVLTFGKIKKLYFVQGHRNKYGFWYEFFKIK